MPGRTAVAQHDDGKAGMLTRSYMLRIYGAWRLQGCYCTSKHSLPAKAEATSTNQIRAAVSMTLAHRALTLADNEK